MVAGFLKSNRGLFRLGPKITTVGREGCDLVIQSADVDSQHSLIEFSESQRCFILQDLNTANGTYVNDCRVQNAAVRLAPGDVIRFGLTSLPYELIVEFPGDQAARVIETTQPNLLSQTSGISVQMPQTSGISVQPQSYGATVSGLAASSSFTQVPNVSATPPVQPRPAWQIMNVPKALPQPAQTLRSRPLSAETLLQRQKESPPILQPGHRLFASQPSSEIGRPNEDLSGAPCGGQTHRIQSPTNVEQELARRDAIVNQFRDEINELKQRLQNVLTATAGGQVDLVQRYCQLESELSSKALEAACLREQVTRLRLQGEGPVHYKQELSERVQELQNMKGELERVKKDKNITAGLLSQVQKDLAGKDTTISRLTREIENLKRELREKDVQLSSLGSKFQKMKELKILEEEREAREKELISLREQFKLAENRLQQQFDEIACLKVDLDKHKKEALLLRESEKKATKDVDKLKEQVLESQRLETTTRADLKAVDAKLERLRSRTVQLLSTSGSWTQAGPVGDEALIEHLVKVIDAEADARRQLKTATEEGMRAGARKERDTVNAAVGKFTKAAGETEERLSRNRRLFKELQAEYDFIQAYPVDDDLISPIKRVVLDSLYNQMNRARLTARALTEGGVVIEDSSDLIEAITKQLQFRAHKISELEAQLQSNKSQLADSASAASVHHREELEKLRQQNDSAIKEAVNAAKNECESRYKPIIDQLHADLSKSSQTIQSRITSLTELTESQAREIGALKEQLANKNAEFDHQLAIAVEEAKLVSVTSANELEASLRAQVAELSDKLQAERSATEKRTGQSCQDLDSYKEQIRQHALTIAAMEERIAKMTKKNKEHNAEIDKLHKEIAEWKERAERMPTSPIRKSKPDPIVLEDAVAAIKRENVELQTQVAEQAKVISSLRRDLTGASARLSDMTGELSEAQKQEIERCKQVADRKTTDLETTRDQLSKLSVIVDKLKSENESVKNESRGLKRDLDKLSRDLDDRNKTIGELRAEVAVTHDKMRQHVEKIEDEGKNRGDLVQLGMQCRGERHEQIIIRQREALAELRSRIRQLEQNKLPIVPTTDGAYHQIQMLKREVTDLRSNQAVTDSQLQDQSTSAGDAIVNAQRMLANYESQLEAERTATQELRRTIDKCEFTYNELVSGIASQVELDQVIGNRTMADLPPDEQDKVCRQRHDMLDAILTRVNQMKDRVIRKDELLKNYEVDLAKISQLKDLTAKKDEQIKQLLREMRGKIEENEFLRENLERTKSRFEQEKRLNSAVKSKKTFHLENDTYFAHSYPKHSCTTPDPRIKPDQKKRNEVERMKKKQYEVATLKAELEERQRQLDDTTLKLHQLQAGLGPVGASHDDDLPQNDPAGDLTP